MIVATAVMCTGRQGYLGCYVYWKRKNLRKTIDSTLLLITKYVSQLAANSTVLAEIKKEMLRLAKSLLEYLIMQKMYSLNQLFLKSLLPFLQNLNTLIIAVLT